MIQETLSYIVHSLLCPRYIKKMGLLTQIIGIQARHRRCSEAWQSHLDKTKQALVEFSAEGGSRLIVFGAGLLNDIPLKELSEKFKEVTLVDIFFLQSTINEIKRYKNVGFEELDVTGVMEQSYKAYEAFKKDKDITKFDDRLKNLTAFQPNFILGDFSHLASVNILSQLPISIKNFFEEKNIEAGENFYQALVKNHIDYLKSFARQGKEVLLISDTEKEVLDLNGSLKLAESSLEGYELEEFGLEKIQGWDWELAPEGELDKKYRLKLKVELCRI